MHAGGDKYTALLEVRANRNAIVSVAEIEITESLRILDISGDKVNPYYKEFDLIFALNEVFSTPVAGELKDYLLSQALTEFVKCYNCEPQFDGL